MKVNTNLPADEYFTQVYRLKLLNQETNPLFSMVLFTKGELIAINIPVSDAFGIHQVISLLNGIVDDFNLLYDTSAVPSLKGDVFPPMDEFKGFKNLSMWIESLENHLKDFEAVLQVEIREKYQNSKRLKYLGMQKTAA